MIISRAPVRISFFGMPFKLVLKPNAEQLSTIEDVTASTNAQDRPLFPSQYALIEFTGALPRAQIYSNWQTTTNDEAILKALPSPDFDPEKTVFVSGEAPASSSVTNTKPGTVEIVSYSPKKIQLRSQTATPSVLLLNDKYDPNWKVWIDGKPDTVLRANYIMQGAYVPAGQHTIEFRFQPEVKALYITLAAIGLGVLLCGVLFIANSKPEEPESEPTAPEPQNK